MTLGQTKAAYRLRGLFVIFVKP